MAKRSKKERERNRKRREKEDKLATRNEWSEAFGLYGGAFVGGRVGLLDRTLIGPLTVGILIGAAGTGAKLLFDVDKSMIATGATSAMQGIGVADAGIQGMKMLNGAGG